MTIDFPPLVQKKIGGMAELHKGLQKNNQRQEHELKKNKNIIIKLKTRANRHNNRNKGGVQQPESR